MSPLKSYQTDLSTGKIQADSNQREAIELLDDLYNQLEQLESGQPSWLQKLSGLIGKPNQPNIKGLYLWGGVGRGKTYLMDLLYESLSTQEKLRTHFHRFMQGIHKSLGELEQTTNPLQVIGKRYADRYKVICLDEFFVLDIGDAMILAQLLDALLSQGIVLVTTSNAAPSDLYENGLQRTRFLPAIALLEKHLQVHELKGGVDYRLEMLVKSGLYFSPLTPDSDTQLADRFRELSPEHADKLEDCRIEILGRNIESRGCADDVIWFDFEALCGDQRSVADYIEIARLYHAVLLGNVPALGAETDDLARRFIHLVDELYDRGVKLVISAETGLESLYSGDRLKGEFERTRSRLAEMQTHEYLSRAHRG